MNPLYKMPLHGVACEPICDPKQHNIVTSVKISFSSLNSNALKNVETDNPIWVMSDQGARYQTEVSLYHAKPAINNSTDTEEQSSNNCHILQVNCQGKGQFHISNNAIDIHWHKTGTDSAHYFQTIGLALWLELNNILCIHANALAYKNTAIALMAPSRMGKTTLTAHLAANGFNMMTDDMIAIHQTPLTNNKPLVKSEYIVYPSWPVARVWPETLAHMQTGNSEFNKLDKVHEQFDKQTIKFSSENSTTSSNESSNINNNELSFSTAPKPLKTVYLLNRLENIHHIQKSDNPNNEECCKITTLSSARAVILLLQNSILGSAYSALNIEQQRMEALSALVANIRFKEITYHSGMDNLANVEKEIVKDIHNSA